MMNGPRVMVSPSSFLRFAGLVLACALLVVSCSMMKGSKSQESGRDVPAWFLDDRKFVHASSSQGVTISPLKYDYWQNNYWQTRRLSVL